MLPQPMPSKKAENKVGDYSLSGSFTNGYHAREDPTTLPVGTLIAPSQNVLVGTSGRVGTVSGYTLDGQSSTVIDSGIRSNYDFLSTGGILRNVRCGALTAAGNDGKIQFRYDFGNGSIQWLSLKSNQGNVVLSFTEFWDVDEKLKLLLWVDGTKNRIYEWNGATTTVASATAPQSGVIQSINPTPTAAGTNYQVGEIVNISGGTGGQAVVTRINGTGQYGTVLQVALWNAGTTGYTTGAGKATTNIPPFGSGSGLTIEITAVFSAGTLTKQGNQTWHEAGFYNKRGKSLTINGTTYTYLGGADTKTLTGVTPDPTSPPIAAGSLVYQNYYENVLGSDLGIITTDPATGGYYIDQTFFPTIIGCGRNNQVYLGCSESNTLYISQVNNMYFYNFSYPVRKIGEGASVVLDAPPTSFIALESRNDDNEYDLYVSEGLSTWSVIQTIRDSTLQFETVNRVRMKVSPLQGAMSERLTSKMKNHIMFVANDKTANFLGYISFQYIPEMVDFSYKIIDDMKSYDFENGSLYYYRNYIFLAIPQEGLIRVYNMTDQTKQDTSSVQGVEEVNADEPWFWESPITYPISGFYIVNGDIYGHGYETSESYKLFSGGSFNGQQIESIAAFSYDDKGDRTQSKGSNELWVEGYIGQNTTINASIGGDLDSFNSSQTVTIEGTNPKYVAFGAGGHSLGKNPLGSQPIGGYSLLSFSLPPWFHVAKTYQQSSYYLEQVIFQSKGTDLSWEIIDFGTNAEFTAEGNNDITD